MLEKYYKSWNYYGFYGYYGCWSYYGFKDYFVYFYEIYKISAKNLKKNLEQNFPNKNLKKHIENKENGRKTEQNCGAVNIVD